MSPAMNHALWFASRATGLVSLLLLSATIIVGTGTSGRFASPRWPRFAVVSLHRNLSLLALAFLVVHIVTSVVDSFVPITVVDTFVPFASHYKPLWLAMGTIASDLMLAVLITSALRRRLGFQAWRSVHLLSYACWATGVVHSIGIGSDARSAVWGVTIVAGCIGAVGGAFVQRTSPAHPH